MRATNGRLVAVGAVGSALIVLVISGLAFRETIAEHWYLWRLESAELEEKRAAIRMLGAMRSERAIPLLGAMMLEGEFEPLRMELLRALVDIGPVAADAIASLMVDLASPPAAPPSSPAAAALPGGTGNQPPPERFDIVHALVSMGPGAAPALVAAVVPGFTGGDVELARRAGTALKGMELEAEGPIAALLADRDPAIRRRTAFVVGWTGIARSALVPHLASMLTDRAPEVRTAAAYAFRNFGERVRGVMPQLTAAFGDEDEDVSRQAIDALAASGVLGEEAVVPLLGILQDASRVERVRRAAARGLGAIGPRARDAVPHLVAHLQATSGSLDFEIVLALGRIGRDARAAVPALLDEIGHEDRSVRVAVVNALGRIAPGHPDVVRRLRLLAAAADEELVRAARQLLGLGALDRLPPLEPQPGPRRIPP